MNISYKWLTDLIDLDLTAEETAAALTRVGLAVEGIHAHVDDQVFDIDLTSNRPDCLSHLGVARELSVTTQSEVQSPKAKVESQSAMAQGHDFVTINEPDLCNRFTARIIRPGERGNIVADDSRGMNPDRKRSRLRP